MGGVMMGFGFIWMLLFWGALILLAVWLISALFPNPPRRSADPSPPPPASAPEILRQRYARGEISTEQYHEMLQTLDQ